MPLPLASSLEEARGNSAGISVRLGPPSAVPALFHPSHGAGPSAVLPLPARVSPHRRHTPIPTDVRSAAMSSLAPSPSATTPTYRRPPGSRVRHGQASCADYGCTLPACRQAAARARRQRNRDRMAGRTAKVDPVAAAEHAVQLRQQGMSAQDISDAAGVSVTIIRRLLRPAAAWPVQIARTTADAVLGIPAPSPGSRLECRGNGLTDAANAAVILAALAAAGWPARYLAARLGVSTQTIAAIRNRERARLRIRLDQRIRHLYPQLAATMPTAVGIRVGDTARARAYHERRFTSRS